MPDIFGNPTEAELRGQAPVGYAPDYLMTPEIRAAIDARNNSGVSTRDVYGRGGLISHEERATPQRDNSANAPSYQGAFMDSPYFQRSDVDTSATNRDVLGNGRFGIRGWLNDHPVGAMAAMIGLAAGGAALMPAAGAGAGTGAAGGTAATSAGAGGAATGGIGAGFGTNAGGLGYFANGGTAGLAGLGGGNAGALAASGAITGGAGAMGGGMLGNLTNNAGRINSLLGAAQEQEPQGGQPMQMPQMQRQPPQQSMFGSMPLQPPILPGVPQGPLQGFSRRPYKFAGQTIWM